MGGNVMSGKKRARVNRWSRSFVGVLMLAIVLSGCQQSPSGDLEAQVLEIIRENPGGYFRVRSSLSAGTTTVSAGVPFDGGGTDAGESGSVYWGVSR